MPQECLIERTLQPKALVVMNGSPEGFSLEPKRKRRRIVRRRSWIPAFAGMTDGPHG
jgi:hypothetical protein